VADYLIAAKYAMTDSADLEKRIEILEKEIAKLRDIEATRDLT